MKNIFAPYRHHSEGHCESRFDHRSDRLRLASLGIFIVTFGTLALADNLLPMPIADPLGGGSAIFSRTMAYHEEYDIVDWRRKSYRLSPHQPDLDTSSNLSDLP